MLEGKKSPSWLFGMEGATLLVRKEVWLQRVNEGEW